MRKQLLTGILAISTLAVTAIVQTRPAEALVFGFQNITNNNATNASIGESQLRVDVTDDGVNGVNFKFENLGIGQSTISEIYFDDRLGALTLPATLTQDTDFVSFTAGSANPPNLPGANKATPPFVVTAGFLADANNPAPQKGINNTVTNPNTTEFLTIRYALGNAVTFNQLIAALSTPGSTAFRIGLHVTNFANGGSESFVTTAVPTPAAVLPALFGMGVAAVRKKKAASEVAQDA